MRVLIWVVGWESWECDWKVKGFRGGLRSIWGGCWVVKRVGVVVVGGCDGSCRASLAYVVVLKAANGEDPVPLLFSHPPISPSDVL